MKKYYATGNSGSGTYVLAFATKKERDNFVAWDKSHDQRRAAKREDARRYGKAYIVFESEKNGCEKWMEL